MFSLNSTVQPHPEVVDTDLDGTEVVLLHLESKTYYSLNVTGRRIWKGLKEGKSLQSISQHLCKEFDVDADHADQSVLSLIQELATHQLVQLKE
jgi:coenzyme PQQ synthesis protein D (PqqD)